MFLMRVSNINLFCLDIQKHFDFVSNASKKNLMNLMAHSCVLLYYTICVMFLPHLSLLSIPLQLEQNTSVSVFFRISRGFHAFSKAMNKPQTAELH